MSTRRVDRVELSGNGNAAAEKRLASESLDGMAVSVAEVLSGLNPGELAQEEDELESILVELAIDVRQLQFHAWLAAI